MKKKEIELKNCEEIIRMCFGEIWALADKRLYKHDFILSDYNKLYEAYMLLRSVRYRNSKEVLNGLC